MKLTWFGGTTLRIHIGGSMLVCDAAGGGGFDREELVSGADRVFRLKDKTLPAADLLAWRPRRPAAAIDESGPGVLLHRVGAASVLVDAAGEPPLLILGDMPGRAGRWSRDAAVVAFTAAVAEAALAELAPRLMALAMADHEADAAFESLRAGAGDTVIVMLERGMALEM